MLHSEHEWKTAAIRFNSALKGIYERLTAINLQTSSKEELEEEIEETIEDLEEVRDEYGLKV